MARLVLLNGAPGSGKSTLARELVAGDPDALAIDVDQIKHGLGSWPGDPQRAGLRARELALALLEAQLAAGADAVLGQYLARPEFPAALEEAARRRGARFHELVLDLDASTLAARLAARAERPDRPEHAVNTALTPPSDAPQLIASLERIEESRPRARRIDARGGIAEVRERLRAAIVAAEAADGATEDDGGAEGPGGSGEGPQPTGSTTTS